MTNSQSKRKIVLDIEGRMVSVPADAAILYFAAIYKPEVSKTFPHRVHVSSEADIAWAFLANTLMRGGYGHVVSYDITHAELEPPVRLECLGRYSYENRDKIPGNPLANGEAP